MFTRIYLVFIFIGTVYGADDNAAKLRLYQKSLDDYSEVLLKNATDMCSNPFFDSNRTSKILIHGFNGKPDTGTAVRTIMKTYLDQEEYNVVLLNWEKLAADKYNFVPVSYTLWAVPNAIKLSSDLADALLSMSIDCLDLSKTHILGHSLGGHVAGLAGNKMVRKGKRLPWITGLDPAGNIWNFKLPKDRLNPKSADFVDVIHSDPSNYGSDKSMGTVDFWPNYTPNGYVDQPGCNHSGNKMFSDEDLCNHNRCWQYMLDTQLKYPGTVLGCYAKDYDSWTKMTKEQKNSAVILEMGKYDLKAKPGNYYLTTNAASQFGRGMDGI